MKVQSGVASNLLCSYIGDDTKRGFDLLVNDVKIATQELNGGTTGRFFDVEYPIPDQLLKDKTTVVVRAGPCWQDGRKGIRLPHR